MLQLLLGIVFFQGAWADFNYTNELLTNFNDQRLLYSQVLGIENMAKLEWDEALYNKTSLLNLGCLDIMPGKDYRYFFPDGDVVSNLTQSLITQKIVGTSEITDDYLKNNRNQLISNIAASSDLLTLSQVEYFHPLQTKLACSNYSYIFECSGRVTEALASKYPCLNSLKRQTFSTHSICLIGPLRTFDGSEFQFTGASHSAAVVFVFFISLLVKLYSS